jgi:hypothetical protein
MPGEMPAEAVAAATVREAEEAERDAAVGPGQTQHLAQRQSWTQAPAHDHNHN